MPWDRVDENRELNRRERQREAQVVHPFAPPLDIAQTSGGGAEVTISGISGLHIGMVLYYPSTTDFSICGHRWLALCGNTLNLLPRTVGDTASSATAWAATEAEDIFTHLWTEYTGLGVLQIYDNAGAPVARGVSAAADWAADRRIALPDPRDRYVVGRGYNKPYAGLNDARDNDGTRQPNQHTHLAGNLGVTGKDAQHYHGNAGDGTLQAADAGGHGHGINGATAVDASAGASAYEDVQIGTGVSVATFDHVHSHAHDAGTLSAASAADHFHGVSGHTDSQTACSGLGISGSVAAKLEWPPHIAMGLHILAEIIQPQWTVHNGADGVDGVGVPAGGLYTQVLMKKSNADYDTEWKPSISQAQILTRGLGA